MTIVTRRVASTIAVVLVAGATTAILAQSRPEAADAGSLAELTAEIRQLRLAVEEATRSQTRTQALGVYLSVQQTRLVQVAARVDAARQELDAVTLRARELGSSLDEMAEALQRVTDPAQRTEIEMAVRSLSREHQTVAAQQQQAQSRADEMSQVLATENARWNELMARLEPLLR